MSNAENTENENTENEITESKDAVEEGISEAADSVTDKGAEKIAADSVAEVQEASDAAEAAEDSAVENDAAKPAAAKPANSKPERVIKKKSRMTPKVWITIIVCAVIIVACVVFVLFKMDILPPPTKASMTMGDYSTIEVVETDVDITDDDVQSELDSFIDNYTTDEEITDGTVEDGDTVNIDYTGYYDVDGEKGETFDGGTGTSYDLEIGSDSFIEGFEDGLIGAAAGDTLDLYLTFPDDYDTEELAGVSVIFEVTVNSITRENVPELNDTFVSENAAAYFGNECTATTVDDLKTYIRDELYTTALHSAMFDYLQEQQTIKSYDSKMRKTMMEYSEQELTYYVTMYYYYYSTEYTIDEIAQMYGYDDAESYETEEAEYYLSETMLLDYIADELGISLTEDEEQEALQTYMENNNLTETYDSVDALIEGYGEAWEYLYLHAEYQYDKVLEQLEDRVTFVEEEETTAEDETDSDGETDAETSADEETTASEGSEDTTAQE